MTLTRIKAKGFTLTELIICMGIMLLVVYISMGSHIGDQTAKQEAEKLEIWLARITQQAIRTRRGFELTASGSDVKITWSDNLKTERFDATPGCTFAYSKNKIIYNPSDNGVGTTNGHFTVTGQDKSKYYIYVSTTGRIRLSDSGSEAED
ncbi:MAG: prepilin-type N-terminal cleavage/methylation domain-containing protein [Synergistaceae bacterium]|nr:prepilin-type N-terminal cleavage/methylation domain-containing protein [Synergistaceae bacterium]